MIITESVEIEIVPYYDKTFYKHGYYNKNRIEDFKKPIKIKVKPEHLRISKNVSNIILEVECDICHKKEKVKFRTYHENVKRNGKYICVNCANGTLEIKEKHKQTLLKKYGVTNYVLTKEYTEKRKSTCLQKYGVESFSQTEEFKEKSKKTMLERYGVEHHSQTDEFRKFQTEHNYYRTKEWYDKKIHETDFHGLTLVDIDIKKQVYTFKCDCGCDHNFDITYNRYRNRINSNTPVMFIRFKHIFPSILFKS
jgi:hypothetical protein